MGLFDAMLARFGYTKAAAPVPRWYGASVPYDKWTIPQSAEVAQQADLYTKISWVQIAISTVAQSAAGTPFQVKKRQGEQARQIINHPFEELLQHPNPMQSRFEFLEATFAYRALCGNAYWWLNRPNETAAPAEIWTIPPQQIVPVPDERLGIRGYAYDPGDGRKIPLEAWEVVHFKRFHPSNKYIGLSPLQALRYAVFGDLAAQEFNTNFFGRDNARIAGILTFADMFSDEDWKSLQAQIARQHGGKSNKRLMMLQNVGKGGVEFVATNISQADMQFLEGRQFTKEEIFSMFAPGLASALAINANEANARSGDATLNSRAVWPAHVAVAEKVTNDLLPAYGDDLVGEFDDVRHKDRALELQEQTIAGQVMTINELRQRFWDLDELDDPRGLLLPAEVGKGITDARMPSDKPPPPPPQLQPPKQLPGPAPNVPQMPPTEEAQMAEADMAAMQKAEDLRRWRIKAEKHYKKSGRANVAFESEYIPSGEAIRISAALMLAESLADIKAVFRDDERED